MADEPKRTLEWLSGGGELTDLIRSIDWSKTALGPIEEWSQSLRTTVSLCLSSNFPINILWGPEGIQIYNAGYRGVCGAAHPRATGEAYSVTWASAWPAVGDSYERARRGETSYLENQRMFLERNGYLEETFFTFSHSPIRDEKGGIAGLFHPVTETTSTMLSARRTRALRDIADRAGAAQDVREAARLAIQTLSPYRHDIPFALFYLFDATGRLRLEGQTGISPEFLAQLNAEDLETGANWPLENAARSGHPEMVVDVATRFGQIPCGEYPEFVEKACVLPVRSAGLERPLGFVIAGVSTRLPHDEAYRAFHEMLESALSAVFNDARAYEVEKKRAEALAEIDQAKTAFFSNVSHEFRTPLTLMLGPIEDMLAGRSGELSPRLKDEAEVVHRNALRLLKLVNALLDFSRIESNRVQASYEPTDLPALTRDLASSFRSAIERSGMKFTVDTPDLAAPAYVDRDMWEKIVLNLLSNAFKYTLQGEIRLTLREEGDQIELIVADTGAGIPEAELPKIFQRFHRVPGAQSRTHEGTGIGLALIQELIKLHGGTVSVMSQLGQGSRFKVTVPKGYAHLPAEHVTKRAAPDARADVNRSDAFVEEARRWIPEAPKLHLADSGDRPFIVLADDNADMRDYIRKLLSADYEVTAVANGKLALAAIRARRPALVLSDIMMPEMDGIELVAKLRGDPELKTVPIILLSARAGEEDKASGIETGADDYLTKPFSTKELLARVSMQLRMAEVRQTAIENAAALAQLEAQQRWLESVLDLVPTPLLLLELESGQVKFANQAAHAMAGGKFPADLEWKPALHAARGERIRESELTWQTPAGSFTLLVDSETVPAISGQPSRVILCLRDVSRMKEVQSELKRLLGARDEFLSVASHELKTPLTSISLQTQMIKRSVAKGDPLALEPSRMYRMVEQTDRLVARLAHLVEDMLDVSRIETGRLTLHPQFFDLSELVSEVVERIAPQLGQAGTAVRISELAPITGLWDRFRVEQVLINLLTNAARYGSGRPVEVGLSADGEIARLWVRDQGIGIAAADHERIFDRFERAISANEVSGLGLGLYIARQIVERHAGTIGVESAPGDGSIFTVRLPIKSASVSQLEPGSSAQTAAAL